MFSMSRQEVIARLTAISGANFNKQVSASGITFEVKGSSHIKWMLYTAFGRVSCKIAKLPSIDESVEEITKQSAAQVIKQGAAHVPFPLMGFALGAQAPTGDEQFTDNPEWFLFCKDATIHPFSGEAFSVDEIVIPLQSVLAVSLSQT